MSAPALSLARPPGFYWVRTGQLPVVGEWTGQQWWIAGIDEPVLDGQFEVVGARICERDDPSAWMGEDGA